MSANGFNSPGQPGDQPARQPAAPSPEPADRETICAVATPPGMGGIGVVRVSGPATAAIARAVCGRLPAPRHAVYTSFADAGGTPIDTGLALYFPAPHSFTGEDVLELQGHGGPVVLAGMMRRLVELGARPARPGEFSERAYLNDKLDLVQAEAIADLVASGTEAAARAAQRSLSGVFSQRVDEVQERLTALRVFVEASIDFPDEEIDFLADSDVVERLEATAGAIHALLAEARQGRILRDGIELAIVGQPNAGKSSLLNALAGADRAIVTEIPGTTRDVLREWIDLDGIPVHLADTAGLRETGDRVEAEGVRRARAVLAGADLALLVVDLTEAPDPQLALLDEFPDLERARVVFNKSDRMTRDQTVPATAVPATVVSARTGAGLDSLKAAIRESVGAGEQTEGGFSARQRHVDALRRAERHVAQGRARLVDEGAAELLAEELRLAQQALGELTGEMMPDDLLGAIFASFCIGK
ncbi:tRNA uridine-5-carboxymethylaminomethyl(34) synthesis GTPase MnmE [Elongatibacter sediminis]|uniref:tRNA modification GTPase MnmE n=1 Tax=Elongatibacter sediminis TaxID=3119006 RepID=A0AAW9R7X9_9GAMM